MNGPNFVCDTLDYNIEHPSSWERKMIVGKSEAITLGGNTVVDTTFRKYQYILTWDAIQLEDFEELLELYNKHIDEQIDITFTYGKWSSSQSGIDCKMEMPNQVFKGGSGNTNYLSSITVVLTEVDPR